MRSDGRLTLADIERELVLSRKAARRLVRRLAFAARPQGEPPTYDPRFIQYVQQTRGHPHNPLAVRTSDWLSDYLRGPHDDTERTRTTRTSPAGDPGRRGHPGRPR